MREPFLIETDAFPFEFISRLATRESWRKEIHRPIYHIHKWWATRLGSVFRGILLACNLPADSDLADEFYRSHSHHGLVVFDPFMGSGTTVGEAHKLGMTALGRDINPVAVEAVRTAFGPLERHAVADCFSRLCDGVGRRISALYRSKDSHGRSCDVLYHFWVMQADCPACSEPVDLFSSHIIARNANPRRKEHVQVRCPSCAHIFAGIRGQQRVSCGNCRREFDPTCGVARGPSATCQTCAHSFRIIDALNGERPRYRLYAKLVLTIEGQKQYLPITDADLDAYHECSRQLQQEVVAGRIALPRLRLSHGYNTRQAMRYNFRAWTDFFNDRQLLALAWLRDAIEEIEGEGPRRALMTLFSGALEFNNMFASYKGEGTGAVRHMFSHHILKPERMPLEANVWGTPKSSGGFSNLFRSRLVRAMDYREAPTEVNGLASSPRRCSLAFSGIVESTWPLTPLQDGRRIYLSGGDSAQTGLQDRSIDLIVTDPPFFDNVHYSELADFFHAWRLDGPSDASTRHSREVQDVVPERFAAKLQAVFEECHRILKDDGLLVFTYHHSRAEGWQALAEAVFGAGLSVVNAQPVRAEMSVATPKSQAKEPIQLDSIIICRKNSTELAASRPSIESAIDSAWSKTVRLADAGFDLSRNDRRVVLYGQFLTAITEPVQVGACAGLVEEQVDRLLPVAPSHECVAQQPLLFSECSR